MFHRRRAFKKPWKIFLIIPIKLLSFSTASRYSKMLNNCLNPQPTSFSFSHGRFISQMEWAPFKSLFWNTNDCILCCKLSNFLFKRQFFMRQTLLLKYPNIRQWRQIPKNYDNVELDLDLGPNIIRKVKNLSPNFKQFAWQYLTLSNILILDS